MSNAIEGAPAPTPQAFATIETYRKLTRNCSNRPATALGFEILNQPVNLGNLDCIRVQKQHEPRIVCFGQKRSAALRAQVLLISQELGQVTCIKCQVSSRYSASLYSRFGAPQLAACGGGPCRHRGAILWKKTSFVTRWRSCWVKAPYGPGWALSSAATARTAAFAD